MTFTINNGNGDIKAPEVRDIETMPKILNVGETIVIKANLTDDNSGVQSAYVIFKNPSGSRSQIVYLKSVNDKNIWEGTYTIKSVDEGGVYSYFSINVTDKAGNQVRISDLSAFKDKMTFTINNGNGDVKPPEVKQIHINELGK
jgi:hypothetical protein